MDNEIADLVKMLRGNMAPEENVLVRIAKALERIADNLEAEETGSVARQLSNIAVHTGTLAGHS